MPLNVAMAIARLRSGSPASRLEALGEIQQLPPFEVAALASNAELQTELWALSQSCVGGSDEANNALVSAVWNVLTATVSAFSFRTDAIEWIDCHNAMVLVRASLGSVVARPAVPLALHFLNTARERQVIPVVELPAIVRAVGFVCKFAADLNDPHMSLAAAIGRSFLTYLSVDYPQYAEFARAPAGFDTLSAHYALCLPDAIKVIDSGGDTVEKKIVLCSLVAHAPQVGQDRRAAETLLATLVRFKRTHARSFPRLEAWQKMEEAASSLLVRLALDLPKWRLQIVEWQLEDPEVELLPRNFYQLLHTRLDVDTIVMAKMVDQVRSNDDKIREGALNTLFHCLPNCIHSAVNWHLVSSLMEIVQEHEDYFIVQELILVIMNALPENGISHLDDDRRLITLAIPLLASQNDNCRHFAVNFLLAPTNQSSSLHETFVLNGGIPALVSALAREHAPITVELLLFFLRSLVDRSETHAAEFQIAVNDLLDKLVDNDDGGCRFENVLRFFQPNIPEILEDQSESSMQLMHLHQLIETIRVGQDLEKRLALELVRKCAPKSLPESRYLVMPAFDRLVRDYDLDSVIGQRVLNVAIELNEQDPTYSYMDALGRSSPSSLVELWDSGTANDEEDAAMNDSDDDNQEIEYQYSDSDDDSVDGENNSNDTDNQLEDMDEVVQSISSDKADVARPRDTHELNNNADGLEFDDEDDFVVIESARAVQSMSLFDP